jgi:hypothetical protein
LYGFGRIFPGGHLPFVKELRADYHTSRRMEFYVGAVYQVFVWIP